MLWQRATTRATLVVVYGFTFHLDGKEITPNQIDEGLRTEKDLAQRRKSAAAGVWADKHARRGSHTAALTDELIDTFTLAGPAEHCVERLLALRALGITKFHVLAADWRNLDPALQEHARKSLVQDVLPGVREGCARYEAQKQ